MADEKPSRSSTRRGGATRKTRRKTWGDKVLSVEDQRSARMEILFETAARMFNRYGYHGASMNALTKELGLTKGALYYYVRDKADLLYQLHLHSAECSRAAHQRGAAEGQTGFERVRLIIKYHLEHVTTSRSETFIMLHEGTLDDERLAHIRSLRKALELDLRDQIESGLADGSIAPCDPKLAAFTIVGALAWVTKWYVRDGDWTSAQVSAAMSDMLSRMIAPSQSSALAIPLR
ncbi:TetR/AcrR family transcriptional regulator [Epibacterium sp. Ofav1-8]|uniref:TetR/AcrR family transcriptional regulator n=1 Tax=Epibacterium sp. Ofav1-8 TaxID=2917735 RepID=UPI001EF4D07B|nr:TetR/AcrR family transcriptional regulator [Epibacterium sp. Ofav1-8]MCG7625149.1 TetR/AcrR family transcriptional regulator [Epibacterium sp. Ofav1-8]